MASSTGAIAAATSKAFHVALFGLSRAGKSCVSKRLQSNRFRRGYTPTIAAVQWSFTSKTTNQDVETIHVWDTGGAPQMRFIADTFVRKAQLKILVFDASHATAWTDTMKEYTDDPSLASQVIVVGTHASNVNPVQYHSARNWVTERGFPLVMIDCKTGENVETLLDTICNHGIPLKRPQQPPITPQSPLASAGCLCM